VGEPLLVGARVLVGFDLVREAVEQALQVLDLVVLLVDLVDGLPERPRELLDATLVLLLAAL